jgi:hypothetical protein
MQCDVAIAAQQCTPFLLRLISTSVTGGDLYSVGMPRAPVALGRVDHPLLHMLANYLLFASLCPSVLGIGFVACRFSFILPWALCPVVGDGQHLLQALRGSILHRDWRYVALHNHSIIGARALASSCGFMLQATVLHMWSELCGVCMP